MPDNLLPANGELYYYPSFFTPEESMRYFSRLLDEISWKQEPIVIFGKKLMQPRLTAWYGDAGISYRYSGITMQPEPWTLMLAEIKNRLEEFSGLTFNSVLLNLYRDGQDSMGWHRDDEKELGKNPAIGSVSFGDNRKFMIRHVKDRSLKNTINITNGSLLLMAGEMQHHWLHSIPKTAKPAGVRINLTFRKIITP